MSDETRKKALEKLKAMPAIDETILATSKIPTCGAIARFTCHGKPVVCSLPMGHRGNHLSANVGAVPISWREGRTIEGDVGAQIDDDMRKAFEPIAKARKDES